jgi:hypothetical protein
MKPWTLRRRERVFLLGVGTLIILFSLWRYVA